MHLSKSPISTNTIYNHNQEQYGDQEKTHHIVFDSESTFRIVFSVKPA
jgi:hypothetical protein